MTDKTAPCPNCLPDGGAYFRLECDWYAEPEPQDVWECENCGHRIPKRSWKRRAGMTRTQKRLAKEIPELAAADHYGSGGGRVDDLRVELTREGGAVNLYFKVRSVNEKPGTFGALFPNYYHIFIGRNGKLTSYAMPVYRKAADGSYKRTKRIKTVTGPDLWKHRRWL